MEVEVIIPVGPGHEKSAIEAATSAMKLGYDVIPIDDTEGKLGRSKARNIGVQMAKAEWIFFLDADDVMHKDAKKAKKYIGYDGIWGLINDGQVRIPQVRKVDFDTLVGHEPTQTLQMGHFIRRRVALDYPFNEALDTGEDFDYYLRVWRDKNCIKIPHTLFINRRGNHSTGPRSANGREWREAVTGLQSKYKHGDSIRKIGDMYLPASDVMFVNSLKRNEAFDKPSLDEALKHCNQKRLAVDGGAHVGTWSRVLQDEFEEVLSVEPSELNFKCLRRNVSGSNVLKLNAAIGSESKKVSIGITDPRNTGQNHVIDGNDVEMVTLDSMNLKGVDFIKFDIEGCEYDAITGSRETLKKYKPVVLVELNGLGKRYGHEDKEVIELMQSLGYKLASKINKDHIFV